MDRRMNGLIDGWAMRCSIRIYMKMGLLDGFINTLTKFVDTRQSVMNDKRFLLFLLLLSQMSIIAKMHKCCMIVDFCCSCCYL